MTISQRQFEFVKARIEREGFSDRVSVVLRDYRKTEGAYDSIVSIEMIEAVGHEFLGTFFATCDWIQKYIFPGALLPYFTAMCHAMTMNTSLVVDSSPQQPPSAGSGRQMKRAALMCSVLLPGCASRPVPVDPMTWHAESLKATAAAEAGSPASGSVDEKAAVEKFRGFFGDLREDLIKKNIRSVYAPEVRFNDTLKSIKGVDPLEHYLVETARSVESCKVEIDEVLTSSSGVYIRWRMGIRFKKFRKGTTQESIGMTHLRFDKEGRVVYHQDYWDSGANLFEKIPVLGSGIRAVKRRL